MDSALSTFWHTLVHVYTQAYRDSPVQTILIIRFLLWTSERSEREKFLECTGILAMYRGKWELCTGILLK